MKTIKAQCSDCVYSNAVTRNHLGAPGFQCRRNPPSVVSAPTQNGLLVQSVFPGVSSDDYCGQFAVSDHTVIKVES